MNYFFPIAAVILVFFAAGFLRAYSRGFARVLKHIAALCTAFLISGLAIRVGAAFAPKVQRLTLILAGLGAFFFYVILNRVFDSGMESRYNYISKPSRRLACLFSIIEVWLILSFIFFYAVNFFPALPIQKILFFKQISAVLLMPIRLFWFFPK